MSNQIERKEAEYCTLQTSTGIMVDMKISCWRLNILIANKLHFTNEVNDLSSPDESGIISFEVGLERDDAW
jgi:hypothetical protein